MNDEFRDIICKLKEPFVPEDHEERDLPGGGKWFYVRWQKIRDRLDEVCPQWQESYTAPVYLDKYCTIGCTITINGVSRQRWGNAEIELLSRSGKDMSRGTPIERAVADAFKSAAESFGVAAYLDEQAADKREFTIRYLHSRGDARAFKAARENGWVPGNLPSTEQKREMAAQERRSPAMAKISENQQKRLWAIAKNDGGYSNNGVKALLETYGLTSTADIPATQYSEICQKLADRELAMTYNREPAIS